MLAEECCGVALETEADGERLLRSPSHEAKANDDVQSRVANSMSLALLADKAGVKSLESADIDV